MKEGSASYLEDGLPSLRLQDSGGLLAGFLQLVNRKGRASYAQAHIIDHYNTFVLVVEIRQMLRVCTYLWVHAHLLRAYSVLGIVLNDLLICHPLTTTP